MGFLRGRIIGFGLVLTLAGAVATWSSVSHQTGGVEATATVLEHVSECEVEYRLIVADHNTKERMECGVATLFAKAAGSQKVNLYRSDFVKLRYVLRDGKPYDAKTPEANILVHNAKVGSQIPVVYDPAHLDDVRSPLTMGALGGQIGLLAVGLVMLMAGLGIGPGTLARAFAGRPKQSFALAEPDEDVSDAAMVARLREAVAAAAAAETKGSRPDVQSSFGTASSSPTFGKRRSAA